MLFSTVERVKNGFNDYQGTFSARGSCDRLALKTDGTVYLAPRTLVESGSKLLVQDLALGHTQFIDPTNYVEERGVVKLAMELTRAANDADDTLEQGVARVLAYLTAQGFNEETER